ncbi:hypothetical protein AQUCO_12900008v1 [Aquilegia coerulea]|uniref:26S proteasome non-ATPase regulatory subunit RPN1 C-terminal domain-containing protein n=1 Tax=Aquilegia coerulea TaxID=218851 RepID=A0A2G5C1A4_AQUCA|nr:hypothetical protein AQUCO_38900001v1 [Aquilegia coerulea]PIA25068.1 hypothetical protein AQUCO_12900008v1 [Aquilegia coerulea]
MSSILLFWQCGSVLKSRHLELLFFLRLSDSVFYLLSAPSFFSELFLILQPRMLMTVDENLKPLSVPVRVGQAVDVVGQAGRPKSITGFQTHSTPVILAAGDRAELTTEKYIPLSPILEGFVILRKNPDYMDDQ